MIDESKTIIHGASGAAGGVGLIPIPFSDALAIAPIQAGMIYKMNDAFGVKMEDSVAASLMWGERSLMACLHSFLLWGVLQGVQPLRLSQKAWGLLI